ncbi:helix-turn-helix domain-containing protein [Faecousia sp.]|jgi:transcriptional regulator with XRE-family HTH domain|uniref:helix-turn-helix domain-containing protein n=1 Tax=Faecousia sp. TaxID=2952921 RepID=UPI003AB7DA7E
MARKKMIAAVYDRSWLERTRRMKGISQQEIAKACGCDVSFYSRVERGLQMPSVRIGIRICDLLDVDIHEFLNEPELTEQ